MNWNLEGKVVQREEGALVEWRGEAARWSMWDTQGATTYTICIALEYISGT